MRTQGKNFEEIARVVGYSSPSGAYRAVMAGLKATLQEPADEVRIMELQRLDVMLEKQIEAAERGIPQAVDRVLRIMERRAKYLGLDAPVRVDYRHIMHEEAQRIAAEEGLDPVEVMAEAERLMLGKA